jgi:hypothetical protein
MKFRTKPDVAALNGKSIFGPEFHLRNTSPDVDTNTAATVKETSSSVDATPAAEIKTASQLTNSENGQGVDIVAEIKQDSSGVDEAKKKPADGTDVDNDVAATIAATSDPVTDSGTITNSGTPEGVKKAWETRRAGGSDQSYEGNEATRHYNKLREIEKAPLAERREAEKDTHEHMKNPESFAEHADWVLNGSYGRGAQKAAQGIMAMGARGNREAGLGQLVAAYDHNSPAKHTINAWKSLSEDEKSNLSKHLKGVIDDHDKRVVSGDY